jgi:hypothetical protein
MNAVGGQRFTRIRYYQRRGDRMEAYIIVDNCNYYKGIARDREEAEQRIEELKSEQGDTGYRIYEEEF